MDRSSSSSLHEWQPAGWTPVEPDAAFYFHEQGETSTQIVPTGSWEASDYWEPSAPPIVQPPNRLISDWDWLPTLSVFGYEIGWEKHKLTTTVLPGGSGGMGMTSVDLSTRFAPKDLPIIQVTPRFSFHFMDGPDFTDVPNQLYDTGIDFGLFLPINDRWSFYGAVSPTYWSDFSNNSSDAFRMMGRALFFYKRSEQLTWTLGFVYLDREDIAALPAVGLTYKPLHHPDWTFDINFPKPRISYQLSKNEQRTETIYLGGEFGGGTWAIERSGGGRDVWTYRDLRLNLGIEHQLVGRCAWFAEAGYVFSRNIEYKSGAEFSLSDTGMIRAGLTY